MFKVQFSKWTQIENFQIVRFLRQTGLYEPNPKKSVQILLQILKPISDKEIWTPGLVGDQIEMVAK